MNSTQETSEIKLLLARLRDGDGEAHAHVTLLLARLRQGDEEAAHRLTLLLYHLLRPLAKKYLRAYPRRATFQTTELLHEALLKIRLFQPGAKEWGNLSHLRAIAALAMQEILIDRTRKKRRQVEVPLDDSIEPAARAGPRYDLLARAVSRLRKDDELAARVFILKFYGDLTHEEAAAFLKISVSSIKRAWERAKTFLFDNLDTV
jgi:RNA polymerase sigma factor (TIGR02999 family)